MINPIMFILFCVFQIIKAARKLEVVVRNVGKVPGSSAVHATYNWIDSLGRAASPPPEVDKTRRYDSNGERKSGLMLLKDSDERKVRHFVDTQDRMLTC